ncbi:phage major capsid protein [Novosphingobium mathurense]|uniref:Phage major capsid protein, HK97 family n=1 Tax=Novosphingobium mathurense TaxID=428990 RepID=A0A1U6HAR4_9SPHN|nr:phage major capsid protein [Novosphingobium mathurense]SLJ92871.1 phage major capsid protein, HK97 family [Novosphingobium mathurense]
MRQSLQETREVIAKNNGALMRADGPFFQDVEQRFNSLKAKSSHPADFRRLAGDVRAWTHEFTGRSDWDSSVDQPVYDGAMAWFDVIDREIENRVIASEALGGCVAEAKPDVWRNAKTGEPIKLYAPDERIASETKLPVSMGELLEGMLLGTKRQEVRNALESGTDTAGGYTVPEHITREFIDRLRAKSTFIQAGARTMMLEGTTRMVRLDGEPTATWRGENDSIGDEDIVLGAITMTPKSLSTLVKVPYELLQDSVNVAEILSRALTAALSTELDRACLLGSGSSNEPLGLFTTPNINSVSMGTNGAVPTDWDDWLDMLYEMEVDNAAAPTAAIWHPRTARTYRKLKDGNNNPLSMPSPIDTLPKLSTTSIPIDQTQGTATDASTVFMGNFSEAIVGMREQLTIIRLDQTYAANGQIGFWARLRADVGFAHGQSFCKLIGITPA